MRTLICTLALGLLLGGCTAAIEDLIELSGSEAQALSDNVEESVDLQQKLSAYTFLASTGGLQDIESYDYTPPDASNDWTGTLNIPAGSFPFGEGDLLIQFRTSGDSGPVDPYQTDLTDDQNVTVDAVVDFQGQSPLGYAVSATADFYVDTTQNGPRDITAIVDGNYSINHGDYSNTINVDQVELGFDMVTDEVTSMVGNMNGSVDIPNFAIDADFDIEGLGDRLDVAIDALATEIHYFVDLIDL